MFIVSYRRVSPATDCLIGKIKFAEGPFSTYEEARDYASKANSEPFTPLFFFVERAE